MKSHEGVHLITKLRNRNEALIAKYGILCTNIGATFISRNLLKLECHDLCYCLGEQVLRGDLDFYERMIVDKVGHTINVIVN